MDGVESATFVAEIEHDISSVIYTLNLEWEIYVNVDPSLKSIEKELQFSIAIMRAISV